MRNLEVRIIAPDGVDPKRTVTDALSAYQFKIIKDFLAPIETVEQRNRVIDMVLERLNQTS